MRNILRLNKYWLTRGNYFLLLLIGLSATNLFAQSNLDDLGIPKLTGELYVPGRFYEGEQFLYDQWRNGKIYFESGDSIDNINLMFNTNSNKVIYLNTNSMKMVAIDTTAISGFTIIDQNIKRHFNKLYFGIYPKGMRFFEVLYSGRTTLLAYRKSELTNISFSSNLRDDRKTYKYLNADRLYVFCNDADYIPVMPKLKSLLSNFDKKDQKEIKKLLNRKSITVRDERSFSEAWAVIEQFNYKPGF